MNSQTKQTVRLAQWYRSAARGLFYLLTFAIPLLALPWTLDALEINKQTLLILGSSLAMIAWLGAMVVERKAEVRSHIWWWLLIAFVVGVVVSAVFSIAPFTSWVGHAGQEYTSVISLISFCALMAIGAHTLPETVTQRRVWSALFLSSAIVTVLSFVQFFSWSAIEVVGTPYAMGAYLSIMTVLSASVWLVDDRTAKRRILPDGFVGGAVRLSMLITIIGSTIILLALDYWLFWAMLLIGTGLLFSFALLRIKEFPQVGRFVIPMALFVIALLFLFLPSVVPNGFASELSISHQYSWDITKQTLQNESWAFGSGPGTFVMDYAQYHSPEINETLVWDQQFDRSSSHILTMTSTLGVIPVALYLLMVLWLAAMALMRLMVQNQSDDEWKMTFVTFGGWTLSVFAQFFYVSNMTLSFVFWLLTAILVSQVILKEKTFTFSKSSRTALLTTFGFVITNVLLLTMLFVSGARYGAEVAFGKAVSLSEQGATTDEVIVQLDNAVRLNRWSDVYQRNLAQAYLAKTVEVVSDNEAHPSEIQSAVERSLTAAQTAVDISESNVLNWTLLGDIYREIAPLISGSDVLAIGAYQKSIELAPNNPKYYVALSRAYVVHADQLSVLTTSDDEEYAAVAETSRREALVESIENLEYALTLKDDYAIAYYYLALAYERSGNVSEAINRMVVLRDANPYDVGVSFQLGLLYLRQGKIDAAQVELERTVALSPSYANAHWYLAAVYEELGDQESAIDALLAILESNPGHETVLAQIARLEAGIAAAEEVPVPLEGVEEVVVDDAGAED
ncbi:tetratricopeptide repeat protein [Candidatus Uhrbacteria bacterium]|jgi:tetratricopeptide (TPR) repeat protein|nr:tetratricopeptide repeat protein [Candidatus Uhrbacteria bacterium]